MAFDESGTNPANIVLRERLSFITTVDGRNLAITTALFYSKDLVVFKKATDTTLRELSLGVDYTPTFKLFGFLSSKGSYPAYAGIHLHTLDAGAEYFISYRSVGQAATYSKNQLSTYFESHREIDQIVSLVLAKDNGLPAVVPELQNASLVLVPRKLSIYDPLVQNDMSAQIQQIERELSESAEFDPTTFSALLADKLDKTELAEMMQGSHPTHLLATVDAFGDIQDREGRFIIGKTGAIAELIDGRDFGIRADSENSMKNELSNALNQAAMSGGVVVLQPGKHHYDDLIDVNGGGGIVCLTGRAQLIANHPAYNRNLISFNGASLANAYRGFWLQNIDFDNATMPLSGLSNGALEYAGFVRLTNIRDVYIANNRMFKNFGGFLLLRNVMDALVRDNFCKDGWKDIFHTTGASVNITRVGNRVYNCGDDAFATVGYLAQSSRPEYVFDFDNYVYGCRRGRAFAYVGAAHVRGRNFVDGRTINPLQALSPNGHHYRGSCALYIASESSFGTYGCKDIKFHLDAQYMGPTVVTPGGGPVSMGIESTNSLSVVRIAESGSAENTSIKDIEVTGTIRNSPRINVFATGVEGLKLNMELINNTDTEGWVGTAGAYTAQASEFQGLRGYCDITLNVTTCNTIPAVFTASCRGSVDVKIKINDVLKTIKHDGVFFESGAVFDRIAVTMDLDWTPPANVFDRLIDIQCSFAELEVKLKGKGDSSTVNSLLTGGISSSLTMSGSPQIVTNVTDDDLNVQIRGGAVTLVEQARVLVVHARPVQSVSGNTLTIAGDVSAQYANTRHCVFLGRSVSPSEITSVAIPISSVAVGGGNTTVTLASPPPAATSYNRVAPLHTEGFAAINGPTTRFLTLPRNRAFRITYSAAPSVVVIATKQ